MSDPQKSEALQPLWTLPQRRALIVLTAIFLVTLFIRFAFDRHFEPDPQTHGDRSDELASRLDPNTADWQAFATIPNVGEKRAKDIIAYRDRARAKRPGQIVFKTIY